MQSRREAVVHAAGGVALARTAGRRASDHEREFCGNLQRYFRLAGLEPAGVHVLRHSAAKLRRDAGESVEEVSRFLDHSSLAVTTVYLRRLEGQADAGSARLAEAIGVQERCTTVALW
jgi:site-specific recombinase XerD